MAARALSGGKIGSNQLLVGAQLNPRPRKVRKSSTAPAGVDILVSVALLAGALVIGLATARDYGFTVDEFNTDDYGPKALAWYTSGGTDRSHLESVEDYLWYYGPWHQVLTAIVQGFGLADRIAVRHAMTFLAGLAALAALIPIARLSVGAWAAPVAILLCLITGYFYGSLFFTPIDVPFMAAMTWATCAILMMARNEVPSWPATVAAGVLGGLAMSTRTGGIIVQVYLVAAMTLCALEVLLRNRPDALRSVAQIGLRTLLAAALAWASAIALWPWLQIGNPARQFATAYVHFLNNPMDFTFRNWGQLVATNALPWHYVPGQFLARLPEGFLLLLAIAMVLGIASTIVFARASLMRAWRRGLAGLWAPALMLARARGLLLVTAAAFVPLGFVLVTRPTHYDGIRHLLFVMPMLAILAGGAAVWLLPWLRRRPLVAAAVAVAAATHVVVTAGTLIRLHPLQYVAMNALAGGTSGASGRFELDYWAAAASEAVRRLESRLDREDTGRLAESPPHVVVCIHYRQAIADKLFRRNWVAEVDLEKADFVITTERWDCGMDRSKAVLIDQVEREGAVFARIYAMTTPSAQ